MQSFYVTPKKERGGLVYWRANYPAARVKGSRRANGRAQRKFTTRAAAEAFLAEAKREWIKTGRIELASDPKLHWDLMRAMRILVKLKGATLERAAAVYAQCCSLREIRSSEMAYEVARERVVELSPRLFLMVQNEARERKSSLVEALEGLLAEVAILRAEAAIRRTEYEAGRELEGLERRNKREEKRFKELEKERALMKAFSGLDQIYENGRQSVLERQRGYKRAWWRRREQARKAAKVMEERSNGTQAA